MPYIIRKLPKKDLYKVINKDTKVVHSNGSTYENAIKQVRLLNMIDAGVPLKKKGGRLYANINEFINSFRSDGGIPTIQELENGLDELRNDLIDLNQQYQENSAIPDIRIRELYTQDYQRFRQDILDEIELVNHIIEILRNNPSYFVRPPPPPPQNSPYSTPPNELAGQGIRDIQKLKSRKEKLSRINTMTTQELEDFLQEVNYNKDYFPNHRNIIEEISAKLGLRYAGIRGKGLTDIDRTSTGVIRVKLNQPAKNFLNNKLVPLITNTTIRITDSRKNSGTGRSQVFGYGNIRAKGFGEFKNNSTYPDLYRALLIFGMKVVPDYIPFTAIQVNHNYKTKKHIDGNNIGLSLAVSFGDFTGGELVIGKNAYQTKEYPVIFNGALTEHFNKPISGDRYSLIFFVSAPKKYSDEEIFKLHNRIISNIKLMKGEGLIGGSIETDKFETEGIVSLPEFRSIKIDLPTYMYKRLPDIKGKPPPYRYKLVIPITSSRNISSRKKETSLNINQKPVSKPMADIVESGDPPNLKDFSPEDRVKIQDYYYKVKSNENKNPDDIDKDEYVIKQRGRPLPCNNAVKPKRFIQPKKPISKKISTSVVNLPPKSAISSFESGFASSQGSQSSQGKAKSKASKVSSSSNLNSEDEALLLNDYEGFKRKYGLDKKKGRGSGASAGQPREDTPLFNRFMRDIIKYKKDFYDIFNTGMPREELVVGITNSYQLLIRDINLSFRNGDLTRTDRDRLIEEIRNNKQLLSLNDLDYNFSLRQEDIETEVIEDEEQTGGGISKIKSNSNIKMANKWIEYVKSYAAKNNMKYSDALKCPKCKSGYKTGGKILLPASNSTQEAMAEIYNETQLGATAGKKFISL
jgi:hypothetical protein